jgi:uncharacterized protein (DUF2235 family)
MPVQNSAFDPGDPFFGPKLQRRKLILCFDGTGNKFQGNDSDSNSKFDDFPGLEAEGR